MTITYKGTLGTVYTDNELTEVYLQDESGEYHDIPEKIEEKLRYRINKKELKAGDIYEFAIDIEKHLDYLEDQLHGPDADNTNLNPEQTKRIQEEFAKWTVELIKQNEKK